MRTLASNPKLWSGMKVKKEKIKQHGLKQLFSINRFTQIMKMNLSNTTFTREELEINLNAIILSSVEELSLDSVDVIKISTCKVYGVA